MSAKNERAMFKKGQKCVVPVTDYDAETGEHTISYYKALVR